MSDWFTLAADMQREAIRAQKAYLGAAQSMVDAGRKMTELQQAGQKAAEANLKLWKQWASLWTVK